MSEDINEIINELNSKEGGAQKEIARLRADREDMAAALMTLNDFHQQCPDCYAEGSESEHHFDGCEFVRFLDLAQKYLDEAKRDER